MAIKLNTSLRPQARPESDAFGPRPTDSPLRSTAQTFGNIAKAAGNIESIVDRADNQAQSLVGLEAYTNFTNEFKSAATELKNVYTSGDENAITAKQEEFDSRFKDPDFNNFRPEGVTKQLTRESVLTNYRAQAKTQYENNAAKNEAFRSNYNSNKIIIDRVQEDEKNYNELVAKFPAGVPLVQTYNRLANFVGNTELMDEAYSKYQDQDNTNLANGKQSKIAEAYLNSQLNEFNRYVVLGLDRVNTPEDLLAYKEYATSAYSNVEVFSNKADGMKTILDAIATKEKAIGSDKKGFENVEAEYTFKPFEAIYNTLGNADRLDTIQLNINRANNAAEGVKFPGRLSKTNQNMLNDVKIMNSLMEGDDLSQLLQTYVVLDDETTIDQFFKLDELGLSPAGLNRVNKLANSLVNTFNSGMKEGNVANAMSAIDPSIAKLISEGDYNGANKIYREKYLPAFSGKGYPNYLTNNEVKASNGTNYEVTSQNVVDYANQAIGQVPEHTENSHLITSNNSLTKDERRTTRLYHMHSDVNGNIDKILLDETTSAVQAYKTATTEDRTRAEGILKQLKVDLKLLEEPNFKMVYDSFFGANIPELDILQQAVNNGLRDPEQQEFLEEIALGTLVKNMSNPETTDRDVVGALVEYSDKVKSTLGVSEIVDPNGNGVESVVHMSDGYVNRLVDPSSSRFGYKGISNIMKTVGLNDENIAKAHKSTVADYTQLVATAEYFMKSGSPTRIAELAKEYGIDFDAEKHMDSDTGMINDPAMLRAVLKGVYANKKPTADTAVNKILNIPLPDVLGMRYKEGTTFEPGVRIDTGSKYEDGQLVPSFVLQFRAGNKIYTPTQEGQSYNPTEKQVGDKVAQLLEDENNILNWEFSAYGKTGERLDRVIELYFPDTNL